MQQNLVSNQEIELASKNKDYLKIANSILKKFQSFKFTGDEKREIFLDALWHSLKNWDSSKSIFTTYLYNNVWYKTLNYINKHRNTDSSKPHEETNVYLDRFVARESQLGNDFDNLLARLDEKLKTPLIQRYVYNMSIGEIGEKNGYKKSYAKFLIKKGLTALRKSV